MEKTIFEAVKEMDFDEFVEWLLDNFNSYDSTPENWFTAKYCLNCDKFQDKTNSLIHYSYCELNGHCKYFPDEKKWWSPSLSLRKWLNQKFEAAAEQVDS